MDRRTRNRIYIWLMTLGVMNLTLYTALYAYIGGDAINGHIGGGQTTKQYVVSGHFLHGLTGGESVVSARVWIYSYLHSLSIIPTCVAILVPLMILARPHVIATMKEGSWMQGATAMTASMTILIALAVMWTLWIGLSFIREIRG